MNPSSSSNGLPRRPVSILRQRLRLHLRELAVVAGLGMDPATLAHALQSPWRELRDATDLDAADADDLTFEFIAGCCTLARWLEPARSAEPVAPFAMVVPGPARREARAARPRAGGAPLVLFIAPADARRAGALRWIDDVLRLLEGAGVDVRSHTITPGAAPPSSKSLGAIGPVSSDRVWGCQSLFQSLLQEIHARRDLTRRPIEVPRHVALDAADDAAHRRTLRHGLRTLAQRWHGAWHGLWRGAEPRFDETWLAGAVNLHDLELRMRQIDRRSVG